MAANISPQLARKLREKASRLLCQQCWVPLILIEKKGQPKPHPCLFCAECLKKSSLSPKNSEKSWRFCNFAKPTNKSMNRDSADQWKPAVRGTLPGRRDLLTCSLDYTSTPRQNMIDYPPQPSPDSLEEAPAHSSVIANSAFKSKLRHFDKTATRCGFCPRDSKKGTLVKFCFHCHKHLCSSCSQKHSTGRLYRYHATVDLTSTSKNGLQ